MSVSSLGYLHGTTQPSNSFLGRTHVGAQCSNLPQYGPFQDPKCVHSNITAKYMYIMAFYEIEGIVESLFTSYAKHVKIFEEKNIQKCPPFLSITLQPQFKIVPSTPQTLGAPGSFQPHRTKAARRQWHDTSGRQSRQRMEKDWKKKDSRWIWWKIVWQFDAIVLVKTCKNGWKLKNHSNGFPDIWGVKTSWGKRLADHPWGFWAWKLPTPKKELIQQRVSVPPPQMALDWFSHSYSSIAHVFIPFATSTLLCWPVLGT